MLKVAHVCNYAPGLSGMYGTVRDLMLEERRLGLQAEVIDDAGATQLYGSDGITPVGFDYGDGADIICWHHAMHENWFNEPHRNLVLFLHGTPEFNFFGELYDNERAYSLIIGASNMQLPRAMVCMWKRHIPFWENLLKMPVHYIPVWANVEDWELSKWEPKSDTIKIAMVDFWRTSREPFGLFTAIDYLRKHSDKKIEVDVWGLTEQPKDTWMATIQWMIEDGVVNLRGNTTNPQDDIYHQCDLVLSMSTEETRVVREGYSCGVPVVCGRHGMDFTDYAADCINPILLAGSIDKCHSDVCSDTGGIRKRLREYAECEFDVKKSAKAVVDLFEDIVEQHGSVNRPKELHSNGKRKVVSVDNTAEKIQQRLLEKKPTAYLRFGDGELLFMSGQLEEGGGHKNSKELRKELIESFCYEADGYMIGSAAGMVNEGRMRKGLFARFESDKHLQKVVEQYRPDETLDNFISLTYKAVFDPKWFIEFVTKCFHGKRVLFLGGESVCNNPLVKAVFGITSSIGLPNTDAYYSLDNECMQVIKKVANDNDIVLCAAGMASEVIGWRLWKDGVRASFIDIGSIADALAGIESRTWIKIIGDTVRENYESAFANKQTDIIVLSHNHEDLTKRCFESVDKHTEHYRMIWMDNGSGSDSVESVKPVAKELLDCELIRLEKNEGFSITVNRALRKSLFDSQASYIALLNNDVIVTSGWLDKMIYALETSGFGAISCLTSEDNPHSLDKLAGVIKDLPKFNDKHSPEQRADSLWRQYGTATFESDNMISFFCCLFSRRAIEQVGLLDENLFAYGEDNDWCERAKRVGIRFGISLGVYVHHDHHATSSDFGKEWIEKRRKDAMAYFRRKYDRGS